MIRTVKINSPINKGKYERLHAFLVVYNECVNYFIKRLWSEHKFEERYLNSAYVHRAQKLFPAMTFRSIQCASKQAVDIIRSQCAKPKKKMPRFKVLSAMLDLKFWRFSKATKEFNWIIFHSVGFIMHIPFRKSAMWDKWGQEGFMLSKSIQISIRHNKLVLEFISEKDAPEFKEQSNVEGLDLGYVNLAVCSDKQMAGKHLNKFIRTFHKREKHTHETITNKCYQELKKLDLSNISMLVVENLKNVKNGTRGKFSRTHNRRLSHWLYAKVINWLAMRCEEQGIRLEFKSPYKTSQRCPVCGKWDRRNRNGEKFKCIFCGHEDHADSVGSQNLKLLGLAGVYSLRLLPTDFQSQCL